MSFGCNEESFYIGPLVVVCESHFCFQLPNFIFLVLVIAKLAWP
jgi:hypothetical protein